MRVFIAAVALVAMAGAASAASISTLAERDLFVAASANQLANQNPDFGASTFGTYGQTVTTHAGSDVQLTSFGFEVNQLDPVVPVTFNAYVYEWTSGGLGTELLALGGQSTGTNSGPTVVNVDVSGMGVVLKASTQYAILFESISGGPAEWGVAHCIGEQTCGASGVYAGGGLLYSGDFSQGQGNFFHSEHLDSSFFINTGPLQPVPVAAALPLLGTGLAAFGIAGWRRRKAS